MQLILDETLGGTGAVGSTEELKSELRGLANDIVSAIRTQDLENSQELLSAFVSELFISATQQSIREERRQRQAKVVADAKARGVKFGSKRKPLPENFEKVRISWRNQEMNLREAAKLCGMPPSTFFDAVKRVEQDANTQNMG